MAVLVVTVRGNLETCHLCAALGAHRLALRVLLRQQRLHLEFAELEVGLDTKQRLRSGDEARVEVHADVARLEALDDVVLAAFVGQFEVGAVEVERRLGVVVQVEIDLIAHFTIDAYLNLVVENQMAVVAGALGQGGVVDELLLPAEAYLSRSLHLELHTAGAEDLVRRTDIELHVGDVELLLVVVLHLADFLLPVLAHRLLFAVGHVLCLGHHKRRGYLHVTYLCADDVAVGSGVEIGDRLYVLRVTEVQRRSGGGQIFVGVHLVVLALQRRPQSRVLRLDSKRVGLGENAHTGTDHAGHQKQP